MMLRWQCTDLTQTTFDGIDEFTLIGVWTTPESVMASMGIDPAKGAEDSDTAAKLYARLDAETIDGPPDKDVPGRVRLYEMAEREFAVFHDNQFRGEPHGAMPYQTVDLVVRIRRTGHPDPDKRHTVHKIQCCGAWLMDDKGDTIETLVRHISIDDMRAQSEREGHPVPTVG